MDIKEICRRLDHDGGEGIEIRLGYSGEYGWWLFCPELFGNDNIYVRTERLGSTFIELLERITMIEAEGWEVKP
jgi:glycine cleavage system aminomethyltransferase T